MISELILIDAINSSSDMIWYASKTLQSHYCPFCDNKMKQVREFATHYLHLNYSNESKNNNDVVQIKN